MRNASYCVFAALVSCLKLSAGTIIGTQGVGASGENCSPFGCPNLEGVPTYQQIYASSAFSGPITIRSITFFNTTSPTSGFESFALTPGMYTLSLSSTSVALDGLSSASPGNNQGVDNQVFFSGAVSGSFLDGRFTFVGLNPFTYDPGTGRNLLLTIATSSVSADTFTRMDSDPSGLVTRRAVFGIPNFQDNIGLVTEFADAPEPSSLTSVFAGILAWTFLSAMRGSLRHPQARPRLSRGNL
jgi:hypothetical protein